MNRRSLNLLFCLLLAGCGGGEYPNRPIKLVCPWGAGGGTDRVSRQIAAHLEADLKTPVNVVNAVGGKGVTGHSQGLKARPDGYTLTTITLELNMLHHSGLTTLSHEDCIPLLSLNEDAAAILVRQDAPWKSLPHLQADIESRPGQLKASGTSTGGAWHLAVAGWLLAAGLKADDVVWVSSTGSTTSLQELLSGGLDMVCCSLPEARTLIRAGQVRPLGVMAPERVPGFDEVPTLPELGVDWTLVGWRAIAVPQGTPQPVVDRLVASLEKIVSGQTTIGGKTFPEFMQGEGFNNRCRRGDDLRQFLVETDAKFGTLLKSPAMQTVLHDRFDPALFPKLLFALIVSTVTCGAVQAWSSRRRRLWEQTDGGANAAKKPAAKRKPTVTGHTNFMLVVLGVSAFLLLAERLGFLLIGGLLMFLLLWRLGTRPRTGILIAAAFVAAVYYIFAGVLRVPLPRLPWE